MARQQHYAAHFYSCVFFQKTALKILFVIHSPKPSAVTPSTLLGSITDMLNVAILKL